jgi:hypothetical protein
MCRIDQRPDPIQRAIFIDELPAWHGDVTKLATYCQARSDAALRSGLCLAVGSIPLGQLTDAERKAWEPVLTQWYETASDGGTHSAAGWALRQWGIAAPACGNSQPSQGRSGSSIYGHDVAQDQPRRVRAQMKLRGKKSTRPTDADLLSERPGDQRRAVPGFKGCGCRTQRNQRNGKRAAQFSPTPRSPGSSGRLVRRRALLQLAGRKEGAGRAKRTGKKRKVRMSKTTSGGWPPVRPATACPRRRNGSTSVAAGR